MSRKKELMNFFDEEKAVFAEKLVDELIFIENQLEEIKKYPMIKVHPKYPDISKPTQSSKLYKDLVQQSSNVVKTLYSLLRKNEVEEKSALEVYLESLNVKKD